MTTIRLLPPLAAATFIAASWLPLSAQALGPLDAEVGVTWWAHDIDDSGIGDTDADGNGAYAELWWADGWGLTGEFLESEPDGGGLADGSSFSLNVKRRLLSPTDNNFIAIGAGWQDSELITGGNAEGVRLTLDGRVGLGVLYVYGQGAWMPDLGDAGALRDMEGTEYQVGVSLTPFPFLNLRLGYRVFELDYAGGSRETDGYILGGAVHF